MKSNAIYAGGETVDRIFRALGDTHRIQIIELLRERELSAGEILEAVDVVQSTLSHHMKTLSDAGVVNVARRGKWTYYSLNEATFVQAADFLSDCSEGTKIRKKEGTSQEHFSEKEPSSGTAVRRPGAGILQEEDAGGKSRSGGRKISEVGNSAAPDPKAMEKPGTKTAEKDTGKSGRKKDKKGKKNKKSRK